MRKAFILAAILAASAALPSCTTDQTSETASAPAFERPAQIDRAPLPPPQGYAPDATSAAPFARYDFSNESAAPETEGGVVWQPSPRWSAVKGDGCVSVEQDAQGRYEVANCSPEDAGATTQPEARDNY
jgi:hypothetical protein